MMKTITATDTEEGESDIESDVGGYGQTQPVSSPPPPSFPESGPNRDPPQKKTGGPTPSTPESSRYHNRQ